MCRNTSASKALKTTFAFPQTIHPFSLHGNSKNSKLCSSFTTPKDAILRGSHNKRGNFLQKERNFDKSLNSFPYFSMSSNLSELGGGSDREARRLSLKNKRKEGQHVRAPEIPADLKWIMPQDAKLNSSSERMTLKSCEGKIVLLDFWTYCCINCIRVLPDLHYLHNRFGHKNFEIIGVHSGKFPAEKDATNVLNAVKRNKIQHPVVVDDRFRCWNQYGIRSWPSFVLIDPDGYCRGFLSGEGNKDILENHIEKLFQEYSMQLPQKRESEERIVVDKDREEIQEKCHSSKVCVPATWELNFPSGIKVLPDNQGLVVSDTGNNRILLIDSSGVVTDTIGTSQEYIDQDNGEMIRFKDPHGIDVRDGVLYIADTGSNAVKMIFLDSKRGTTLAGDLRSPWDLCVDNNQDIVVSLAGSHKIVKISGGSSPHTINNIAGNGGEACVNGVGEDACFAQPSGMALYRDGSTGEETLYVADSESSSIRKVELKTRSVTTVCGGGGLFSYGYEDGKCMSAMFQHCMDVAVMDEQEGLVLIAVDTFNSRLRMIDVRDDHVTTVPLKFKLNEPGAVDYRFGKAYITDTNNHRVVVVDMASGTQEVLEIR